MVVGPMEIGLVAALGLLALVALLSAVVVVLLGCAMTMAPVLAALGGRARRRAWRSWHPSLDWVPGPEREALPDAAAPTNEVSPPPCDVGLVDSAQGDVRVRLLTARVPAPGGTRSATVTAVRATLSPAARLDLPREGRADVAVYVVSGRGTVGSRERPVAAGELAVLPHGEAVTVSAAADSTTPLTVLVLGGVPAAVGSVTAPGVAAG